VVSTSLPWTPWPRSWRCTNAATFGGGEIFQRIRRRDFRPNVAALVHRQDLGHGVLHPFGLGGEVGIEVGAHHGDVLEQQVVRLGLGHAAGGVADRHQPAAMANRS
jgi:hypothetical protein